MLQIGRGQRPARTRRPSPPGGNITRLILPRRGSPYCRSGYVDAPLAVKCGKRSHTALPKRCGLVGEDRPSAHNPRGCDGPVHSPGKSPATWVAVTILLLIGIFGTLWVPIYARTTPMWGDFPLLLVPADLGAGGRRPVLYLLPAAADQARVQAWRQPARERRRREVSNVNAVSFTILIVLFAIVTVCGFAAARWRRAEDMMHLNDGAWEVAGSARSSAGSCSAATCTRPTRSSRCPRLYTPWAQPGSSRCRTRSWSSRSCSCSPRGCGRSPGCTTT